MRTSVIKPIDPAYLGDAVYAVDDGWGNIILRLDNHANENGQIILDESVLSNLNDYNKRRLANVREHLKNDEG